MARIHGQTQIRMQLSSQYNIIVKCQCIVSIIECKRTVKCECTVMQCDQLNSSKSNSCRQLKLSLVLPDCQQAGWTQGDHDHQKLCNNIHCKVEMHAQSMCTCLVNFARLTINAFAFDNADSAFAFDNVLAR